jgi:hypothetical protein
LNANGFLAASKNNLELNKEEKMTKKSLNRVAEIIRYRIYHIRNDGRISSGEIEDQDVASAWRGVEDAYENVVCTLRSKKSPYFLAVAEIKSEIKEHIKSGDWDSEQMVELVGMYGLLMVNEKGRPLLSFLKHLIIGRRRSSSQILKNFYAITQFGHIATLISRLADDLYRFKEFIFFYRKLLKDIAQLEDKDSIIRCAYVLPYFIRGEYLGRVKIDKRRPWKYKAVQSCSFSEYAGPRSPGFKKEYTVENYTMEPMTGLYEDVLAIYRKIFKMAIENNDVELFEAVADSLNRSAYMASHLSFVDLVSNDVVKWKTAAPKGADLTKIKELWR